MTRGPDRAAEVIHDTYRIERQGLEREYGHRLALAKPWYDQELERMEEQHVFELGLLLALRRDVIRLIVAHAQEIQEILDIIADLRERTLARNNNVKRGRS